MERKISNKNSPLSLNQIHETNALYSHKTLYFNNNIIYMIPNQH